MTKTLTGNWEFFSLVSFLILLPPNACKCNPGLPVHKGPSQRAGQRDWWRISTLTVVCVSVNTNKAAERIPSNARRWEVSLYCQHKPREWIIGLSKGNETILQRYFWRLFCLLQIKTICGLKGETHPSQALLKGVQDDELGEVEVLLRSFSKYPLRRQSHPKHHTSGFGVVITTAALSHDWWGSLHTYTLYR